MNNQEFVLELFRAHKKILMQQLEKFKYKILFTEKYYESLSRSDKAGSSTIFIEFMLEIIERSLESLLQMQNISLTGLDRVNIAKDKFQGDSFSRQEYLRCFKNISSATASRDLITGVDKEILIKTGDKRLTKYKYKK